VKLTVPQKRLMACLISAIVPVGLGIVFLAAQGWNLARPDAALSLALILAVGVLFGALAVAWAGLDRQDSVR
jgi:hypothetical protein